MSTEQEKIRVIHSLVIVKAMFMRGSDFAKNTSSTIDRLLAIHCFDNSVEMVMKIFVDYKKISLPKDKNNNPKKHWEYYDLLKNLEKLPTSSKIGNLHEERNNVHHRGDVPSFETLIKYQGYTEDFLKEVFSKEFETCYDTLSLADLIDINDIRVKVKEAESAFNETRYNDCVGRSDEALQTAVFDGHRIVELAGKLTGYWGGGGESNFSKIIRDDYSNNYNEETYKKLAADVSKSFLQLGQALSTSQFLD